MKIYTVDHIADLTEDLANSLKLIQTLPENTIEGTMMAFMDSLSFEQLVALQAINSIREKGEDISEEEIEKLLTRSAVALNTMQSCGVQVLMKASDIPEAEQARVLSIMEQMVQRPEPSPQPHPMMAMDYADDPWG
jgi:glutamyl-tRNA reductase